MLACLWGCSKILEMPKRKSLTFVVLFLIIFTGFNFLSCSKKEQKGCKDPNADNYNQNATQDDNSCSYQVSAKVDGVLFGNSAPAGNLIVQYGGGNFLVLAYDSRISGEVIKQISIVYSPLTTTGTYELNTSVSVISPKTIKLGEYIEDPGGANQISYETDSTHTGTLVITKLDTINRLISGTFNFTALQDGGTAIINVTDGQFTDLEY